MVGVNPEVAHEQMAGLNFFHAIAQALEAGKLFHIDLNDQKPGRFDQDLRFGSESIKADVLPRQAARGVGLHGPRHFDAHAYRTEDHGRRVGVRARLHADLPDPQEKVKQFDADTEIQALLTELPMPTASSRCRHTARAAADALKARSFDRVAIAAKRLPYEQLDQLVIELLLGVR